MAKILVVDLETGIPKLCQTPDDKTIQAIADTEDFVTVRYVGEPVPTLEWFDPMDGYWKPVEEGTISEINGMVSIN